MSSTYPKAAGINVLMGFGYLKMVFGHLQDEEVGMVGIWGMGGVGKTTLLQKINNHPVVASAGFDYVILLVVSQDLDLDRLQKETAKRLGLTLEEGTSSTLDSRAQELHRYLSNKSFLLLDMNVIDDFGDPTESYNKGYDILQILKRACLLEENKGFFVGLVKMHDVIRGMALWIISECKKEWVIIDQAKRENESDGDGAGWDSRDAKTISLIHGRPGTQLPQHPDCPTLSALTLRGNRIDMIPERFFQNMNALTCLDMSDNSIIEIPAAIGRLRHLRYLDLSYTFISSLPVELGDLTQLRRLSVNFSSSLRSIPHGLIQRLQKLEQLELFRSAFNAWGTEGQASIEELVLSGITSLSIDVRRLDTLEQLSKNRRLSLWMVAITELEGVTALPLRPLLRNGNTRRTLLSLDIRGCEHLEEVDISCRSGEEFDSLERFYVYRNPALKKITFSGGSLIQNVRELFIRSCDRLKNATWIAHLPYLESLEIVRCNDMEHVIADEEDDDVATKRGDIELEITLEFSKLRAMELVGLPELRSFSTRAFSAPQLTDVRIEDCPKFDAS